MQPPAGGDGGAAGLTATWGESLRLEGTRAHCAHCDAELGELGDDWRRLTGVVALSAQELGPLVQLPDELSARQYVCPACATALWVEVIPAQGPLWTDFRLR
jgi:N-methylhydantoinase B